MVVVEHIGAGVIDVGAIIKCVEARNNFVVSRIAVIEY
jgi:hypothetical protein